jgi:hypothetical protein
MWFLYDLNQKTCVSELGTVRFLKAKTEDNFSKLWFPLKKQCFFSGCLSSVWFLYDSSQTTGVSELGTPRFLKAKTEDNFSKLWFSLKNQCFFS